MIDSFKNASLLIIGLGRYAQGTGISAAKFFSRHGAYVTVNDQKTAEDLRESVNQLSKYKRINYVFAESPISLLQDVSFVFQNPGVPDFHPLIVAARRKKIPIINDWSMFFMHRKARCVAVTGTRGKTTTTTLLYKMIRQKYRSAKLAGNIGVSPLTFLNRYNGELVVAELSSWLLRGLRTTDKGPHIAVVTNIMRDHQNAYKTMNAYVEDKELIFKHQTSRDYTVLNYDDLRVREMVKKTKGNVVWIGETIPKNSDGVFLNGSMIVMRKQKKEYHIIASDKIRLQGTHNLGNALAAVAAAFWSGVSVSDIAHVLRTFKGVPNRMQKIRSIRGTDIYNDTTATTPDATIAAVRTLSALPKPLVLIAGGADKELDFREWGKVISTSVSTLILIPGNATEKMKKSLAHSGTQYKECATLDAALSFAMKREQPSTILFSPGAASYNMFKNEFDRGDQFVKLVKTLS